MECYGQVVNDIRFMYDSIAFSDKWIQFFEAQATWKRRWNQYRFSTVDYETWRQILSHHKLASDSENYNELCHTIHRHPNQFRLHFECCSFYSETQEANVITQRQNEIDGMPVHGAPSNPNRVCQKINCKTTNKQHKFNFTIVHFQL